MKPVVLVVTSVHPADDPRIRSKLVETLRTEAQVHLVAPHPGPSDPAGISVDPLRGGRLARSLGASRRLLVGRYDVASVHDPELLPAAILAGLLRNRVVFDVHEDLPAQMASKSWIPGPLRGAARAAARLLLRLAERVVEITLAEPNYAPLFAKPHPVFPNYLPATLPEPVDTPEDGAVYLGDITEIRGAVTAVEAVGLSRTTNRLTMIGRCPAELADRLRTLAASSGVTLELAGYLPHAEALRRVAAHRVALSPLHDVPNYRHSMPTKLLEYLAIGLPVVASDLPGSRAALGENEAVVWVPPGAPVALAEGIDRAVGSEPIRSAAVSGADRIRTGFRWPEEDVRRFYLDRG